MSADTQLHTTDANLAALWGLVDAPRRKNAATAKVTVEALEQLRGLLKDHHTLVTALQRRELLKVTLDPTTHRSLT